MAIGSLLLTFLLISVCIAWEGERPIRQSRDGYVVISSAENPKITLETSGKACGGQVTDASGVLLPPSPPYNASTYYCKWKLEVPETMIDPQNRTGSTLTVTISGLIGNYTATNKFCDYKPKYIRVKDEDHGETICGNITGEPYIIRSPSPSNTIEVVDNRALEEAMSFNLQYKWTRCGGILTGPMHVIKPPATSIYPKSCVWHAKFDDPGAAISMSFNSINLGSCDKGYIIVRNGGRLSPKIGKFCGNIKPPNITSSSNELWIEYWALTAPGDFEIQLETLAGSCGGVYRGKNKELTSPGFPKQYPKNSECTWEITADPGYTIGLVFVDWFGLETSYYCLNDFVQIFDWIYDHNGNGQWEGGPKYCSCNFPPTVNTTSNRMKIIFRSDEAIQGNGFRAKWEQNCGGIFEAKGRDQYIQSPFYPANYPSNLLCNYTIKGPPNKEIRIEFLDFEVEGHRNCKYDYVMINTFVNSTRKEVWRGCTPPPTISTTSTINILFRSDLTIQKRGFRLKYFWNGCGGEITEPTVISSPTMKSDKYYSRLNCTWVIRAPKDKNVVLRFEKFELQMSARCSYEKLLAVEGETLEGTPIAILCGNISDPLPPPIRSGGNVMAVMFKSDAAIQSGGLKATILFTNNKSNECGGKVNLTTSTQFRTQKTAKYDALDDCHWTITTVPGKNIRLTINRMDLKNATNITRNDGSCSGDFLEVREGGIMGDIIGQYCGNQLPHPVTSTLNVMWIRLFTDSTLEGEGVSATLEPIESPCGRISWNVNNETRIIESPGYPGDFPLGVRCRWNFKNNESFPLIYLHFKDLDMENTEKCEGDHIEVYGNNRYRGGKTYKYCGQAGEIDFFSYTQEIHVLLKSTLVNVQKPRKFKFEVSHASCNHNYTSEQGRILYHTIDECWTTITAPSNRTISLYFKQFRFLDPGNCTENYVKVHDGDFKTPPIETLCGMAEQNPIFSTGNVLSIHSKSGYSISYATERFDIIYTTTDQGRGCGGKIFEYNGLFTSPMYPHTYRKNSSCLWEIIVPRGYEIVLEFSLFDFGTADICSTDYLQVTEVKDGGRVKTFCPGKTPDNYRARTNQVKVLYSSSINNSGTGWIIRFGASQDTEDVVYRDLWSYGPIP